MNDDAAPPATSQPLGQNFRRLLPAAFSANLADGLAGVCTLGLLPYLWQRASTAVIDHALVHSSAEVPDP